MQNGDADQIMQVFAELARLTAELKAEMEKLNRMSLEALEQGKFLGEGDVLEQSRKVDKLIIEIAAARLGDMGTGSVSPPNTNRIL